MVTYELDKAHTTVGFTARHLAVSTVRGQFNTFEGHFEGPEDDVTKTTGEIKIDVASIDTRQEMRDNHLRSADFFEAEKYPYITFRLNRIEPKWVHGKRAIVEPARLLTAQELKQRVCDYFECELLASLPQKIS